MKLQGVLHRSSSLGGIQSDSAALRTSTQLRAMEFEFEPGHSAPVVRRKAPDDNHRYKVTCAGFGLAAPNPAPHKNGVFAIPPHKFWPPQDGSMVPKPEPGGKFYGATYVFSKGAPKGGACSGQQYWPDNRSHLSLGLVAIKKGKPPPGRGGDPNHTLCPPPPPHWMREEKESDCLPRTHAWDCGPQCYCLKYSDSVLKPTVRPKDPR